MQYTSSYESPLGHLLLAADNDGLTSLWFDDDRYFAEYLDKEHEARETPVLAEAKRWLDIYFAGREPDFLPPIHLIGTPFQVAVWKLLQQIPYGKTTTYGELAQAIAKQQGRARMSSQAVGGAVGHNGISIIVPCHRVVGKSGSLTGYGGGLPRKIALLKLEGAYQDTFFVPKRTTAP